ncbi:MAG: hypothetical protein ACOY9Y_08870 [Bacillota bacterium]
MNEKDKRFPDSQRVYRRDVRANELDEEISGTVMGRDGQILSKSEQKSRGRVPGDRGIKGLK